MEKMNKEKLIEAVKNISSIAQEKNWVLTLDRDEGALFYSPKIIPDNSELFRVTDEYAVYLDKKHTPQGVMVEAYNQNFVKHHPEFKKITKNVFGEDGKEIETVDPLRDEQVASFRALFERVLVLDASNAFLHKDSRMYSNA